MDLTKAILQEHTKQQALKIAEFVGDDPKKFKLLVEVYLTGPYRVTQRAAWPLGICAQNHPQLIIPHLRKILDCLEEPGIHDAVKRNTIRLLQFIKIPKRFYGRIANMCFAFLQDRKESVAVRVFSMSVLADICQFNPDLKHELKIVIEDQLPYATPAFLSRAKKILREIV